MSYAEWLIDEVLEMTERLRAICTSSDSMYRSLTAIVHPCSTNTEESRREMQATSYSLISGDSITVGGSFSLKFFGSMTVELNLSSSS